MTDPTGGNWERLDESPAASAQMIQWHAPETYRLLVTAALEAVADEIDEMVASSKSPVAGEDWHGFVIGYACSRTDAARIVRNLATPPP